MSQLVFRLKGPKKEDTDNSGMSIYIEEKIRALRKRQLTENMLSYLGPHIGNPNLNESKSFRFAIKMEQFIDSELDVSKNCRNYPTEEYSSFAECDEKFVQQQFLEHFGDIKPFWVADNMSEVTR